MLPLADGVGLAISAMTWWRSLSVGILADAALVPEADKLATEITDVFRDYRTAARRLTARARDQQAFYRFTT